MGGFLARRVFGPVRGHEHPLIFTVIRLVEEQTWEDTTMPGVDGAKTI